jgi:NAD(P)H-nitrite reductase large subunit
MAKFDYKYLIVGASMTADSAVQGIREHDEEGSIGLIGKEEFPPYARPPLSKALWKGEEELEEIDLGTEEYNPELYLGKTVEKIDRENRKVYDNEGNEYSYEKLLIATGGKPLKLSKLKAEGIIYYRTKADYKKLKALVDKNKTFGVIGGGFIGSEIVAGIKIYKPDAEVTMIFPEPGVCGLIFPKDLTNFLNTYYRENGVIIHEGELVNNIEKKDGKYHVTTKSGKELKYDVVVAGLGIEPNITLAKEAGLDVKNGIKVNELFQTNDPNIYAAGDVALYPLPMYEEPIRVEHEDNAIWTGWTAGVNMASEGSPYEHQSMFYSDLFDYGYEAVGILNPKLDVIEDWKEKFEEGVIYYLDKGKVKGILLWNVWEKVDDAREIIASKKSYQSEDLKGKL